MGEDELVAWLRERPGTALIGDDTAELPDPPGWIVTVDQQIEGVHVPAWLDPEARGRRLVAVNLSDLAAAGASPVWGFLALAAPSSFEHRRFLDAVARELAVHGAALAGGDLARAETPTTSLTLLGRLPEGLRTVGRGGARPGDRLWVGGPLGLSALGLRALERGCRPGGPPELPDVPVELRAEVAAAMERHLAPVAQLELGRWLLGRATAVLDVSDGLTLDLSRMLRASDCGARLDGASLELRPATCRACEALDVGPEDAVLGGGEDYVLLFTLSEGITPPPRFGARAIGRIVDGEGIVLEEAGGGERRIAPTGWDHLEP